MMVQPNNGFLVGKKEIARYVRRSWDVIMLWIQKENFPAEKHAGVWESCTELIDEWRKNRLRGGSRA